MHCDSAYTKISANSGWARVVLCQRVDFQLLFDPVLRSVMAQLCTHYDTGAKLFAYLDDWYLWIKPQCLLQTIAVITAATRSVVHQDTGVERLLPGLHSTGVPR